MYSDEYDDVWRCFVFIGVRMDIVKLRSGCQIFWVDGFERLFLRSNLFGIFAVHYVIRYLTNSLKHFVVRFSGTICHVTD